MSQEEICDNYCNTDPEECKKAVSQLILNFDSILDKQKAWEDLHRFVSDENKYVRRKAVEALDTLFVNISNKNQAWEDLIKSTLDEDKNVRRIAAEALKTAFRHISDKEQAWKDLHRLISEEDSNVRRGVVETLKAVFQSIDDKEQAWEDLHRSTSDENGYVQRRAAETLGAVFRYISDKEQAWEDLHNLSIDEENYVRVGAAKAFGTAFQYIPDKKQAWEDLHRLVSDEDKNVRKRAAGSIKIAFQNLTDKKQVWEDLVKLTADEDECVRREAAEALVTAFQHLPDKKQAWDDLHTLTLHEGRCVRQEAATALRTALQYVSDKEQVWKDLHRLTLDENHIVRRRAASAMVTVFQYIPDKKQAWEDLHRLTVDEKNIVRQRAVSALETAFQFIPDRKRAWDDLIELTADEERYVRLEAARALAHIFQYVPDKEKAWEDLSRLAIEGDKYVRPGATEALGSALQYTPDKGQAWEDLHKLTLDENRYVRDSAAEALGIAFQYIPCKEEAWKDLIRLTSDKSKYVKRTATKALGIAFQYIPDKEQAWKDLHELILNDNGYVLTGIAEALGIAFQYIPDKEQAWEDLHRLTLEKNSHVRFWATKAFGTSFQYIRDKKEAGECLHILTLDENKYVKSIAAEIFGTVFQYIPDKKQALDDLQRLISDEDINTRVRTNNSLGKISIYKASISDSDKVFFTELENAINFFEIASNEAVKYNPSSFCLPFYRSFYTIIFNGKKQAKDEVDKYLTEAKNAIKGSENKKILFEAVENLAKALNEVQSLENMDTEVKRSKLSLYRKYCEQTSELINKTERTAPSATIVMRKGLPLLDKKLKSLLEEIQEKAETACQISKGTATEEITCVANRKVQEWEVGTKEEIELEAEDLLIYIKSKIPRLPENEHIFEKIKHIEEKRGLRILLRSIRDLFEELPKIMIDTERMKPTIGIITALPKEYAAVNVLLENKNDKYKIPGYGAGRRYCLGEILSEEGDKHNLVLATSGMGNNIAATRASLLLEHFPNIKSIIMVGIAGGVPYPNKVDDHVRLGDIVVSNENGVIQYDFIKQEIKEITHRNPPRPPSASLLEAVRYLEAEEILGDRPWEKYVDQALLKLRTIRPSEDKDVLYSLDNQTIPIKHPEDPKRIEGQPRVFTGPIASANILQKDPKARDKLREKFGVKAIEMEASGIADATWNHEVGYLVVRGICDYCDSHKNDEWQQYAAVVAAAYTRALIESMP